MNYKHVRHYHFPVTGAQVSTLRTLQHRLHIDDETYREMLAEFNVKSTKDLTRAQAGVLITNLSACAAGSTPQKKYYGTGERGESREAQTPFITQLQADRIALLEQYLEWQHQETLAFIIRQTGTVKAVQMLLIHEASNVIIGMQKLFVFQIVKTEEEHFKNRNFGTEFSAKKRKEINKEIYKRVNNSTNEQLAQIYKSSKKYAG